MYFLVPNEYIRAYSFKVKPINGYNEQNIMAPSIFGITKFDCISNQIIVFTGGLGYIENSKQVSTYKIFLKWSSLILYGLI